MDHKALTILLVEDDEIDAQTVIRAFKKNRLTNKVIVAGNGLEGLKYLNGCNGDGENPVSLPRVVLLDLNMPKMNGIEFLQAVRKDANLKNLYVVVLTTSDEEQDKVEAYNLNVAGYILKPVDFNKFISAVGTLNAYWTLMEHLE